MLTGIAVGLVWFAAFLMTHVGLFHCIEIRGRSKVIAAVFAAAVVGSLASTAGISRYDRHLDGAGGGLLVMITSAMLVMFSLFILYMPFFYAITNSLSVRTLITILRAPGSEISLDRLKAEFASRELVQKRLDAMVLSGLLSRDGSEYRLTKKGRRIARTFNPIKALWRLGPGG